MQSLVQICSLAWACIANKQTHEQAEHFIYIFFNLCAIIFHNLKNHWLLSGLYIWVNQGCFWYYIWHGKWCLSQEAFDFFRLRFGKSWSPIAGQQMKHNTISIYFCFILARWFRCLSWGFERLHRRGKQKAYYFYICFYIHIIISWAYKIC